MFEDDIEATPLELGADQLQAEDQGFMNADEGLAQDIASTLEGEELENNGGLLQSNLVRIVMERYQEADNARYTDEQRWLSAYQNYRGAYSKNYRFNEFEKSRVFIKATKTKVLAAYGQLIDVLFGTDKFPISISETKVPEGAEEFVHYNPNTPQPAIEQGLGGAATPAPPAELNPFDVGFDGDGLNVPPGATFEDITAGLKQFLREKQEGFREGPSVDGSPQFKPAHQAAMRMEKLIHDQIEESNGGTALRSSLLEMAMLGTGIIKGPFTYEKVLHKWEMDPTTQKRTYKPEKVKVPRLEFCSIWNAFPDPSADNPEDMEWFIQRHKLSKTQLRSLKSRPYFKSNVINEVIKMGPNYVAKDFENELEAENTTNVSQKGRYEVLEYWGVLDREDLNNSGVVFRTEHDHMDEVQVNVWVCHGKIIRIAVNPFTPARIPYLMFDYERNPYHIFGIGVAENMADSQMIMNGHARMAIDNLALAGNMVFDVDENALAPGQTMEIYPGKVFKRQSGQPGQAIYGITFPNTAPENLQMFDKFRQLADETTGIPSYAHGQTGVMSTTRTAAGMSMLMGAASLNVKTVVKNIDDFLLKPLGEALFQWNMSFYEGDLEVQGDLEVRAGGAASLMQKEVVSQRLTNFGQLLANPAIAPWVKIPAYVKAFVESLELNPEEFLNDPEAAQIAAEMIGAAGGLQGGMQAGMGSDMGQMGNVPAPAQPGDEQFTGNPEQGGAGV